MDKHLIEVSLAILYQGDRFLLQLRDDFPHIVHPGIWGFFGGHIEPDEDSHMGVKRELLEEIGYAPPEMTLWKKSADERIQRYFYYGELAVPMSELQLNEGQDMALCSIEEIRAGGKYSERLGEVRLLGKPHQQALLTFAGCGLT